MLSAQEAHELTIAAHTKILDRISKHIWNRAQDGANSTKHCFKEKEISPETFDTVCKALKENGYDVDTKVTSDSYQVILRW